MGKLKIAIISNDDTVFSLYAWNNVFRSRIFTEEYECMGFWICDQKFKKQKGPDYWEWYLRTFKLWNFIKLSAFVISFKFFSFIKFLGGKYQLSFKKLCTVNKIPFGKTPTPNSPDFIAWTNANKIDVLIIMVDHILKQEVLSIPKVCVLNKHASLLPTNKGLFPFFWATIANQSHGITFHKVTEKIDVGDFYYQETEVDGYSLRSMVAFYFYAHKNYYKMLRTALENISIGNTISIDRLLTASYNSLPTAEDYMTFKKTGGKIVLLSDIFLPLTL